MEDNKLPDDRKHAPEGRGNWELFLWPDNTSKHHHHNQHKFDFFRLIEGIQQNWETEHIEYTKYLEHRRKIT